MISVISTQFNTVQPTSCYKNVLLKIREFILEIFRFLAKVITFPLRYFGSKSWSLLGLIVRFPIVAIQHLFWKNLPNTFYEDLFGKGYHRFGNPTLSPEQVKPLVKYACANMANQVGKISYLETFGYQIFSPEEIFHKLNISNTIRPHNSCFFDFTTGLKLAIHKKNDEFLLSFGGLAGVDSETEDPTLRKSTRDSLWNGGFGSAAGIKTALFMDAEVLFSQIKELPEFKDKRITLTGQCLGGTIASYLSLKHQFPCIVFNSLPMGAGLQYEIGDEKLMDADKYVTNVIASTDYFADLPKIVGVADAFLGFLGFKTPGNFGRKFFVPTAYKSASDTHRYILGSLMQHMGYHCRTLPQDIKHDPKAIGIF